MSIPGLGGGGGLPGMPGAGGVDPNDAQAVQTQKAIKLMNEMQHNCFTKTAMSGVVGFGLGGVFGMFMASMSYDTPYHTAGAQVSSLPWRQQLRAGFRDMGQRSWTSARSFGKVGAIFTGVECAIEGFRARNDMVNGVASGCVTGAILARNAGPQAAAVGCAGFAAFSAAIEAWMRQPKEE